VRKRNHQGLCFMAALASMAATALTAARANVLSQPYSVTNLGAGTATLSTTASGNGIVTGSGGQSYLFTPTSDTTLTEVGGQGPLATFPNDTGAPINDRATYGNPDSAFSHVTTALMNGNGVVAALETYGVGGEWTSVGSSAAELNSNGTWTNLGSMPINGAQTSYGGYPTNASLTAINDLNQVLGTSTPSGSSSEYTRDTVLFNINTQTFTDLSTAPYLAAYIQLEPVAIDDQGRILVTAWSIPAPTSVESTLLLTPAGVTSEPLSVPAPEPGALAVMALAAAGFAGHRLRERRNRQ
jgi:hypothetical protein